jgi:hypothetical protein
MRKVLFASVAVLGLAATPLMAQTTLNSKDSAGGSVNTPAGGANVGGSGSLSGSSSPSGTYNRDRDPSQAQAPPTRSRDHDADRDKMNRSDDNSARPYAPGQQKKGY